MKRFAVTGPAGAAAAAMAAGAASGQVFDLRADWSETRNPNGPWSLNHGAAPLPHVDAWQRNLGGWSAPQPGWARSEDANTRLPFWFRSNGSEMFTRDFVAGDIVVHSTDLGNGVGSGAANVTWTAPGEGFIDITGGVWHGREIGRSNRWTLRRDGASLTTGVVADGDPYSRANPFRYELGSSGPGAVRGLPVFAGSILELRIERVGLPGEFAGVALRVEFGPGCYADCDAGSGLDVFDFLCFQNLFAMEAGRACNCDVATGANACDVFDFLCFQNAFAAGCP